MSEFTQSFDWYGPSDDPNDEQFGDVVEPTHLAGADRYDAVLVGEPVDQAVIGRPGAAKAPKALRTALATVTTHHFAHGPVGSAAAPGDGRTTPIGDLGDVAVLDRLEEMTEPSVGGIQHRVSEVTAQVHDVDALCVFLGGDNSLTYPNVEPLLESGSVGVVNCDAHLDVREVGEEPTSGTPYRQLFDVGLDGYACLGARNFETSTAYADYVHDQGGAVLSADAVAHDPDEAAARALAELGHVDHVYVSVDLDVLDAAHAPGVSAPTPGGLSTRELFRVVGRLLADDRVRGFEVVECAPPLDRDGRTVRAGARTIAHALSAHGAGGAARGDER